MIDRPIFINGIDRLVQLPSQISCRCTRFDDDKPGDRFYRMGAKDLSLKPGGIKMRKQSKTLAMAIVILSMAAMTQFILTDIAAACGWGQSGGGGYVPQRRDSGGLLAQKSSVTEERAREIVSGYVKKLNPDLEIGKVTDNGGFYEVEVVDSGNEIVQLLGVDKRSGRLILLN